MIQLSDGLYKALAIIGFITVINILAALALVVLIMLTDNNIKR